MSSPGTDKRSADRRARDEQIVAEPLLAPLDLPADAVSLPVEGRLPQHRRPLAVVGVVENGLVRPVDHCGRSDRSRAFVGQPIADDRLGRMGERIEAGVVALGKGKELAMEPISLAIRVRRIFGEPITKRASGKIHRLANGASSAIVVSG